MMQENSKIKAFDISIRPFGFDDIENKINWINNPENNKFLHYELPLVYEKTVVWFEKNKERTDRYDAVIECDKVPVGLIGLLSIDRTNKKAEFYISMGETEYKGKGIAAKASALLLDYAFDILELNKVYLYTETENTAAQKLFAKLGFEKEGTLVNDLLTKRGFVDRYIYGLLAEKWKSK